MPQRCKSDGLGKFFKSISTTLNRRLKLQVLDAGRHQQAVIIFCVRQLFLRVFFVTLRRKSCKNVDTLLQDQYFLNSSSDCIRPNRRRDTLQHLEGFIELAFIPKLLHFAQHALNLRHLLLLAGHQPLPQLLVLFSYLAFQQQQFVDIGQKSVEMIILHRLINGLLQLFQP